MAAQDVKMHDAGPKLTETPSIPGEVANGPKQNDGHYVGVVYFHGMGEQRRMEEVSRLVESLETFLRRSFYGDGQKRGYFSKTNTKTEPHRVAGRKEELVNYTITHHMMSADKPGGPSGWQLPVRTARFYEVYWAPYMAGGRAPWAVTKWIVRQIVRPFHMLRTPWGERQRLRRSTLAEMAEDRSTWPEGTKPSDFNNLLDTYDKFGRPVEPSDTYTDGDDDKSGEALKASGSFTDFEAFVKRAFASRPNTAERRCKLARAWWWRYFRTELFNLGVMLTVALAGVLMAGLGIAFVLQVLTLIVTQFNLTDGPIFDYFEPTYMNAAGLAGAIALAGGMGRFLSQFMGDVQAWTSLSETDALHERRKAVLNEGMDVLRHVLADPKCQRVLVVSHSLGTSVAHDTLLALAQRNEGHNNDGDVMRGPIALTKIRHLVTIASPIDKINYFFESYRTSYRTYSRAYEAMRGDILSAPFSRNTNQPYVHWVNYWDGADVISGALQSPTGANRLNNRVNNVHVSNHLFPSPGKAHSAYFQNRTVISQLFEMIYYGVGNYDGDNVPYVDGDQKKGKDYKALDFAPLQPAGSGAIYRVLAAIAVWAAAVASVFAILKMTQPLYWAGGVTLGCAVVILVGWLSTWRTKNREPL